MTDHETQLGVSLKRRLDLECEIIHHIQQRGVRLGLIRDEGAAKFEEDKFFHASIVTKVTATYKVAVT